MYFIHLKVLRKNNWFSVLEPQGARNLVEYDEYKLRNEKNE